MIRAVLAAAGSALWFLFEWILLFAVVLGLVAGFIWWKHGSIDDDTLVWIAAAGYFFAAYVLPALFLWWIILRVVRMVGKAWRNEKG